MSFVWNQAWCSRRLVEVDDVKFRDGAILINLLQGNLIFLCKALLANLVTLSKWKGCIGVLFGAIRVASSRLLDAAICFIMLLQKTQQRIFIWVCFVSGEVCYQNAARLLMVGTAFD